MKNLKNLPGPILVIAVYFIFSALVSVWWGTWLLLTGDQDFYWWPLIWFAVSSATAFFVVRGRFKRLMYYVSLIPLVGATVWVPLGIVYFPSFAFFLVDTPDVDVAGGLTNPHVQRELAHNLALFAICGGSLVLPFALLRLRKIQSHFS